MLLIFYSFLYYDNLDNFLNSSKSHNLNEDVDNLRGTSVHSPYSEQDDLLIDGRHERTGSVKFADQAEAGKEVFQNFINNTKQLLFLVYFRVHYNDIILHIRKTYAHGKTKWQKNFKLMEIYFIMIINIHFNRMLICMMISHVHR